MLTVVRTGPQALVQDGGRPGYAHLGVPPSGALDLPALERANRLVGNPAQAAGIEALLGGVTLRSDRPCLVAVTGADPWDEPVRLEPGEELRIGTPRWGLRRYLAVSGGIAVPAVLGSRSTDVLTGIGPAPLSAGDTLPLGPPPTGPTLGGPGPGPGPGSGDRGTRAAASAAAAPGASASDGPGSDRVVSGGPLPAGTVPGGAVSDDVVPGGSVGGAVPVGGLELAVLLGPRDGWFDSAAEQLTAGEWTVSPSGNRVGVRLDGTVLRRAARRRDAELPTEPVVTGSVQVPPSGRPVIFLNDHPTTGGYPVVAVVHPAVLPALAQARPGTPVRLVPT